MATRLSRTDKNSIGKFLSEYISHHQSSRQAASAKLLGNQIKPGHKNHSMVWCYILPFCCPKPRILWCYCIKVRPQSTPCIYCKYSVQKKCTGPSRTGYSGHGHHVCMCITHSFKCLLYLSAESNPVYDLAERVQDMYSAVLRSESCMEKIVCELGGMAKDLTASPVTG